MAEIFPEKPVPVGPEPQALPLRVVVELNDLRMRLAGMANPPREVFLALYEGAEPELFTTVEAARECCDDLAKTDARDRYWDWTVNEHGIHVQFWTHPDDDRPLSETSGTVTPIVVQGDEPVSELEQLQARVAELEAERKKYVGVEPTVAEEMAYLSRCLFAVHDVCDDAERQATRWENPLPVPEWVARVRAAADGLADRRSYPPVLPWAQLMDEEDLGEFLNEVGEAAIRLVDPRAALAEVEQACATWRVIAEAQHAHNTAPGPDAESHLAPCRWPLSPDCTCDGDGITARVAPTQALRADVLGVDPVSLRWGLDDVEWADDDSTIVLLSGPDGEPYTLELEPSQAAVLRENLAGPDGPAVFRAAWDTEQVGPLYGGEAAARAHCVHDARLDYADGTEFAWRVFEESVAELVTVVDGRERSTGYTVTRVPLAAEYVPDAAETGGDGRG